MNFFDETLKAAYYSKRVVDFSATLFYHSLPKILPDVFFNDGKDLFPASAAFFIGFQFKLGQQVAPHCGINLPLVVVQSLFHRPDAFGLQLTDVVLRLPPGPPKSQIFRSTLL